MAYKLDISEHADNLIDSAVLYLLNRFHNHYAAKHLLDGIDEVYGRLEDNPYQFKDCYEEGLGNRGYKESVISDMDYKIIFRIDGNVVHIVGMFHSLEDYAKKITDK